MEPVDKGEGRAEGGWVPLEVGFFKLNVDAGELGEGRYGWGFFLRNQFGDILMAGSSQGRGFTNAELEETRACLFAIKQVLMHGFDWLIVERDCLSLVTK